MVSFPSISPRKFCMHLSCLAHLIFIDLTTRIITKTNKLIKYMEIINTCCEIIRHAFVHLTLQCIISKEGRGRISVTSNIPKYENWGVLQYHAVSTRPLSSESVSVKTGNFSVRSVTICHSTWRNIPDNRTITKTAMRISYLAGLTKHNSSNTDTVKA